MMQANEQGSQVEVLKVNGPQENLSFWSSDIVSYWDIIEHMNTCGFEYRHGYSIKVS